MKKRKILFLINDLYLGGAQRVLLNIIKNLPRTHFDVSLVVLSRNEVKADLSHEVSKIDVLLIVLNGSGFFGTHKKLAEILRKESPDIVHAHLPLSVIHAAFLKLRFGRFSLVTHEHNSPLFYSWKIRIALFFSWAIASRIICYTSAVKKELDSSLNSIVTRAKSIIVPNGILSDELVRYRLKKAQKRTDLAISDSSFVVVTVARLLSWKGHDVLIRAFHQMLHETEAECFLLIVGDGPERASLVTLIDQLGCKEKIKLLEETTEPYEIMAAGDVFVSAVNLPPKFGHLEAVGLSALEAMAIGLPVVLSRYPTTHSFIKNEQTAFFVEPGNSGQLSKILVRLQNDSVLRDSIGKKAAIAAKSLDWGQLISVYLALYAEIIKEQRFN